MMELKRNVKRFGVPAPERAIRQALDCKGIVGRRKIGKTCRPHGTRLAISYGIRTINPGENR
jgi:hypothetical protein